MDKTGHQHWGAFYVPQDSQILRTLTLFAYEKSVDKSSFVNRRMVSVATAVAVVGIAILHAPLYAARALLHAGFSIIRLNQGNELSLGTTDLKNAFGSLALSAMSIFLIAGAIISPKWAFSTFEYMPPAVPPDPLETLRGQLTHQINELEQKLTQKETALNKANAQLARERTIQGATLQQVQPTVERTAQLEKQITDEKALHQRQIEIYKGQIKALHQELEKVQKKIAEQTFSTTMGEEPTPIREFIEKGFEVFSVKVNQSCYFVVSNPGQENSSVQADRLKMIIRRAKNEPQDLEEFLHSLANDRLIIDLSKCIDKNYFPIEESRDLEVSQTGPSTTILELAFGKNHPTKSTKYSCWMNDLRELLMQKEVNFERLRADFKRTTCPTSKLFVEVLNLIEKDYDPETHQDSRQRYQRFCTKLDELCATLMDEQVISQMKEVSETLFELIQKTTDQIVMTRWMEVSLDGYLEKLVDVILDEYKKLHPQEDIPERTSENFGSWLIDLNKRIGEGCVGSNKGMALLLQKLMGELGGEDFTGRKNPPHLRSRMTYQAANGDTQEVCYVRTGCPTSGSSITPLANLARTCGHHIESGEKVVPNFKYFLSALSRNKEAAFIAVHQQHVAGNPEESRVVGVINLQKEENNNVAVLVQPVFQGWLAEKTGPHQNQNTFDELKEAIKDHMFNKKDGPEYQRCQLPGFITGLEDSYESRLNVIIDFVKDVFFKEVEDFSNPQTWQEFLLIFYTFQQEDLLFFFQDVVKKQVTFQTTPCKDFLDRGGIVACISDLIHAMLEGRFEDDEVRREIIRNVLGPPIMVKRISMREERLRIVEPLYQRLLEVSKNPESMQRLAEFRYNNQYSFVRQTVPEREKQHAILPIGEIKCPGELVERLQWLQGQGKPANQTMTNLSLFSQVKKKEVPAGEGRIQQNQLRALFQNTDQSVEEFLNTVDESEQNNFRKWFMMEPNSQLKDEFIKTFKQGDLDLGTSKRSFAIEQKDANGYYSIKIIDEYPYLKNGTRIATVQTTLTARFNPNGPQVKGDGQFRWDVSHIGPQQDSERARSPWGWIKSLFG